MRIELKCSEMALCILVARRFVRRRKMEKNFGGRGIWVIVRQHFSFVSRWLVRQLGATGIVPQGIGTLAL